MSSTLSSPLGEIESACVELLLHSLVLSHRLHALTVLQTCVKSGWQLVECLPGWPTRGLADAPGGRLCIRAGEDTQTHGFFVARFERSGPKSDSKSDSKSAPLGDQRTSETRAARVPTSKKRKW